MQQDKKLVNTEEQKRTVNTGDNNDTGEKKSNTSAITTNPDLDTAISEDPEKSIEATRTEGDEAGSIERDVPNM